MGTTEPNNLPYPELSDLPDIPADMRELAESVESLATALSSNLLAQFQLPKVYSGVRTQDDGVASPQWGNAAGLFATNVPKGTLMVYSVYYWRSAPGYSWFRTKVNGSVVPGGLFIDSGPGGEQIATTSVSSVAFAGGNLTVGTEFGFTTGDCFILNGSQVIATIFPDPPTV